MPSVDDIFIAAGVAVGSTVGGNEVCVGIEVDVAEGTGLFVARTAVGGVLWQAANKKMEKERIIFFIYFY